MVKADGADAKGGRKRQRNILVANQRCTHARTHALHAAMKRHMQKHTEAASVHSIEAADDECEHEHDHDNALNDHEHDDDARASSQAGLSDGASEGEGGVGGLGGVGGGGGSGFWDGFQQILQLASHLKSAQPEVRDKRAK